MEKFIISLTDNHPWGVILTDTQFVISGEFSYLKNREVYKSEVMQDTANIQDFMGMNYYSARSYKKCIGFVLVGTVLEVFKAICDKLSDLADHANYFLQFIGQTLTLPGWLEVLLNLLAVATLVVAAIYLLSKKSMIEISFRDKRFCIPYKQMTQTEFDQIYANIRLRQKAL